jgi:hypothetical protein
MGRLPIATFGDSKPFGSRVNFYQTTRCYNPEDSNLHTHRRENPKSYYKSHCFFRLINNRDLAEELEINLLDIRAVGRTPDDGGCKYLRNVCQFLRDYKAQHPRRQSSLYSPP